MNNIKKQKGFTIVELLIVIVVIGILAAISVAALTSTQARARDAERRSEMRNVKQAIEMFYADNGFYPTCNGSSGVLSSCMVHLLSDALIPTYTNALPKDPFDRPGEFAYYYARGYKKNSPTSHMRTDSILDYSIGAHMETSGLPTNGGWGSQINFMDGNP